MNANYKEIVGPGVFEQEKTEITEREVSIPSVSSCSNRARSDVVSIPVAG
jgi:hypothetical protein